MALGKQVQAGDGAPSASVAVYNRLGAGGFVIVCEHATNHIPPQLNGLGLGPDVSKTHIAWDLGAMAVAEKLSVLLDGPLVVQNVSRLVYDCNRPPGAADVMAEKSEIYEIPGNVGLSPEQRDERRIKYFEPFKAELAEIIESRSSKGRDLVLITVHSFTPVYEEKKREFDIGIIHDSDSRLADEAIIIANSDAKYDVRRNEPYGPADGVTFTLIDQGISRGMLNMMIEIRNDLITDENGQNVMAETIAKYITGAIDSICKKPDMSNFPCCSTGN